MLGLQLSNNINFQGLSVLARFFERIVESDISRSARTAHPAYRPDIDGLRAIAVLMVVFHHLNHDWLPGGFVGVDVFFVISGYVITLAIVGGAARGEFSLLRFYLQRARRLLPPLIAVLVFCMLVGWYFQLPSEFRALGKHVAAGSVFVANFVFWYEGGYFDTAASKKVLLHLWSLGVEEQYYIIWPMLLMGLARKRYFIGVLAFVGMASLCCAIYFVEDWPLASFFLLHARFWELSVGGGIALYGARLAEKDFAGRRYLWLLGVFLILISACTVSGDRPFPDWRALYPVLGAALVVWFGHHEAKQSFLASKVMVWIGLLSYSLYLWHWPIIVFCNRIFELSIFWRLFLLVPMFALAILSYRVVEVWAAKSELSIIGVGSWVLSLIVAACGAALWLGWIEPVSAKSEIVRKIDVAQRDGRPLLAEYYERMEGEGEMLLMGDSHMQHYLPWFKAKFLAGDLGVKKIWVHVRNGCAPVPLLERPSLDCYSFTERGFAKASEKNVKVVVIAASWFGLRERKDLRLFSKPRELVSDIYGPEGGVVWNQMESLLASLVRQGKRVILVASTPRGPEVDPENMVNRFGASRWNLLRPDGLDVSTLDARIGFIDERLASIARRSGAVFVRPTDYMCSERSCAVASADGMPYFFDGSHLTATYARDLWRGFDFLLKK